MEDKGLKKSLKIRWAGKMRAILIQLRKKYIIRVNSK